MAGTKGRSGGRRAGTGRPPLDPTGKAMSKYVVFLTDEVAARVSAIAGDGEKGKGGFSEVIRVAVDQYLARRGVA